MTSGSTDLSAMLLSVSLGITAARLVEAEEDLDRAALVFLQRLSACRSVLTGRTVCFRGLARLKSELAALESPVIVAATELGSINLSVAALRLCGVRIVTPYWDIADAYRQFATVFDAALVSVSENPTPARLARAMLDHRADHRVPFLVVEAPSASGRRYNFLNCAVRCSRFLSWGAHQTKSRVMLIWNRQAGPDLVDLGFEWAPLELVSTEYLLSRVDTEVRRDPAQYAWENTTVLFSDEDGRRRSFGHIRSIINWREKFLKNNALPCFGCG